MCAVFIRFVGNAGGTNSADILVTRSGKMHRIIAVAVGALLVVSASNALAQASACASDAECGVGKVCAPGQLTECPDGQPTCESGETDEACISRIQEWRATNCEVTKDDYCFFKYQLPCEAASDCGDGFTCEAQTCKAVEQDWPSMADDECPDGWSCIKVMTGSDTVDGNGGSPPEGAEYVYHCVAPADVGLDMSTSSGGPTPIGAGAVTPRNKAADSDGSGCAVRSAPTATPGWLAAVALMAGLVLRRRKLIA
jgi:MYXO-CTERM domain-containing protein